jgi:hypothetical protein
VCANDWFLYLRDATEEYDIFFNFKIEIMQIFIRAEKSDRHSSLKIGRSSTSSLENQNKYECKKGPAAAVFT